VKGEETSNHERDTYAMLKNIQIVHPPSWLRYEYMSAGRVRIIQRKQASPLSRESPHELEDVVSFLVRVLEWASESPPVW